MHQTTVELLLETRPTEGVTRSIVKYPIMIHFCQGDELLLEDTLFFDERKVYEINFEITTPIKMKIYAARNNSVDLNVLDFPIYVNDLVLDGVYQVPKIKYSGVHLSESNELIEQSTNVLYDLGSLVYTFVLPFISMVPHINPHTKSTNE